MYSSSYETSRQAAIAAFDTYLAAAAQKARTLHTRDEGLAILTKAVEITSTAYDRAARALNDSTPAAVQAALQTANDAASAFEKADSTLKKAIKGPTARDEAAITAALDALDAALLAVSVAARNAASFDDGAGDTYDAHADAEYAIRRVFDLTN